jgi:DegV family protein with EDD domain
MNLTAANTGVVLDSTSDWPEAATRFPNMRVVPLYVRFGDETFRDHVDLAPRDFYERLRQAPELPTTSQPTPRDFADAYEQLAGFERLYVLTVSAKLSGTFQSAELAAEGEGGRVRIVDTETASMAMAMLALAIQRRLERGTTEDEIDALIERFRRDNRVVFTVGTLEYLAKGGRIGKAQAMAGTILNVRPILSVEEGVIVPIARVRGRQKALEEFGRLLTAGTENRAGLHLAIAHADAPEWVEVLTDLIRKARPLAEIDVVAMLGAVVGTHAGPGAVGFFWFQDSDR